MDEAKTAVARDVGPLTYVLFLLRGPFLVTTVMVVILLDFVIPGSMKEALRYSLLDQAHWYQFAVIAVALLLACAAVRFSGEAIIELVAPDIHYGPVRRLAHLIPRLLAASLGFAVAVPLIQIVVDGEILKSSLAGDHDAAIALFRSATQALGLPAKTAAQGFAVVVAGLYIVIALFIAIIAPGPHTPAFETRDPTIVTRVGLALFPLLLAATFAVAVMGSARPGIAHNALERYSTAFIAPFADGSKANEENALWTWVCGSNDPDPGQCDAGRLARYAPYITDNSPSMRDTDAYPRHFVDAAYSIPYVLAMLLSLFAACYASRLAVAAFVDLLLPALGSGRRSARFLRRLLPPLASAGLGIGVALQFYGTYFPQSAEVTLNRAELAVASAIMAAYVLIGAAASFGSSSSFAETGPWRDSPSVGRRFVGGARRLAALDPFWHWFIRGLLLLGGVIFFVFSNLSWVAVPQWIGPVGIILLWGATCTAVLFFLSYIGHATHIPFLTIIAVAALAFSGFNINENHGIRLVENAAIAKTTTAKMDFAGITNKGQTLELVKWLASRNDLDRYQGDRHYPVFLVATEGGGARAAYFTATILAALQERCPAFAQHTIAISGVSGGSLGASVFAALAAGATARDADPQCRIEHADVAAMDKSERKLVLKARQALSADLLSPLLGAMLFPDALQRMLPFPIPQFDRARAIEYAVEKSWKDASIRWDGDDARYQDAFAQAPEDLYTPHNSVPNLILNSTETGSGANVPLLTANLPDPLLLNRAQIDAGNINCGEDWQKSRGSCVLLSPSPPSIKSGKDSFAPIPLSAAAIVSARFPFLTPAATFIDPHTGEPLLSYDGHFVDGGYFENSGTFMLSRLLQNLVSEQMCLKNASCTVDTTEVADKAKLEKAKTVARNAVFVVIVIQSEPCTRRVQGLSCEEAQIRASGAWSELLSPVKALLSTRDARANYTSEALRTTTALIEELNTGSAGTSDDVSCSGIVCAVTLRFFNKTNTEVPLTWVLSDASRRYIDEAVDSMESADVRTIPALSYTHALDPLDENRVLGSYRRILCLMAPGEAPCQPRPW